MTGLPPTAKVAEGLDDVAGGLDPLAAAHQNEAGRRDVQGQAQQGGQQQHRGKGAEFQRLFDVQGEEKNHQRDADAERQQQV